MEAKRKKKGTTNREKIRRAAKYITRELKKNNHTVMRYDAITSNSVYLKIDEGVAGSIRISDHNGKKGLKYRYNMDVTYTGERYKRAEEGLDRFYFPFIDTDVLVKKIEYDYQVRLERYGEKNYNRYRELNYYKGKKQRGFWRVAKYM